MVFESVKKERLAKAWNFFLFEKETENAKCPYIEGGQANLAMA